MVFAVFLVVVILIAPIFLTAYFYYNAKNNRLYFAVYAFGVFKLLSGYVKGRVKGGIYIHLSNNNAVIFDLKAFKDSQNGPNIFNAITLTKVKIIADVGVKDFYVIYLSLILNKVASILYKILRFSGKISSQINVFSENLGLINVKIKLNLCFNMFCIVKSVIANAIYEGVSYVKAKSKRVKGKFS